MTGVKAQGDALLAGGDPLQAQRRAFGKALAAWRAGKGLTPLQAARHLGLTHDYYLRAETGRMHPGDVAPSTALGMIAASGLTARQLGLETDQDPTTAAAANSPGPDGATDGGGDARRAGCGGSARAGGGSPPPGAGHPDRGPGLAPRASAPGLPVPANLSSDIFPPEVRLVRSAAGDMLLLIAQAPVILLEPCAARLLAAALVRTADLAEA